MKTKLYFIIIFLSLFFSVNETSKAQSPDWQWAKAMGGTNIDLGRYIAVDAAGNVYTIGYFFGTVDFDPGPGTFNLVSAGGDDIFISKLDNAGNFIWTKSFRGTGGDIGYAIALDASCNVYTTGSFQGTVDFDPGAGTFNLTATGGGDIFISKLDSAGNFIWAKSMGGTDFDYGQSIALDASGNVYTTGQFFGTADFDPDTSTFNLTSAGTYDIFISKLDSSGKFVWAKRIGGTGDDIGYSLVLDASGNVYTTGQFFGTVDFNPGLGIFNLTSAGNFDVFISKLDSSGNYIWAKAITGTTSNYGLAIALDVLGNVYTTGSFSGTVDFDPDSFGNFNLTSAGLSDIFISKLDSSGIFVWAKAMGETSYDNGNSIAVDPSGNVYTTGVFSGTVDFDPDTSGNFNLSSVGSMDIFISKLNSSGNFVWAKAIGGTVSDRGYSLTLDAIGNVYVTGYFYSPFINIGSTTLTNADNTGSTTDIFIAKLDTLLFTGNIEIENLDKDVSLFPNPAVSQFTIALSNNKKFTLTITDITGKIIYTTSAKETNKIEVSTKDFLPGIYFVQIQTEDFIKTKKLIIQK